MKVQVLLFLSLVLPILATGPGQVIAGSSSDQPVSYGRLAEFAQCITKEGWIMYSSFTCSACRAQRELFGQASDHLEIIECHPHAPDTQVQRCLDRQIRYTPTWLVEKNGTEVKRIKGYKSLTDLAALSGCRMD